MGIRFGNTAQQNAMHLMLIAVSKVADEATHSGMIPISRYSGCLTLTQKLIIFLIVGLDFLSEYL